MDGLNRINLLEASFINRSLNTLSIITAGLNKIFIWKVQTRWHHKKTNYLLYRQVLINKSYLVNKPSDLYRALIK